MKNMIIKPLCLLVTLPALFAAGCSNNDKSSEPAADNTERQPRKRTRLSGRPERVMGVSPTAYKDASMGAFPEKEEEE